MKKLLLLFIYILFAQISHAATINVGYKCDEDYIYQYDGIGGLEQDARVGAFIRLTPDMLRQYAGAKIKSLRIGWADPDHTSACEIIIRTELDSQKGCILATGKGTLRYMSGWNIINFDEPLVIADDIETIYVGYYANVKKGSYAISKVYPTNQPGSCFLWRNDLDKDTQGNELWTDLSTDFGALAIQAVVDYQTIIINQEKYKCNVGEAGIATAQLYPELEGGEIEWTSSDSSILFIDKLSGMFLGLKDGIAYITASLKSDPTVCSKAMVIVGDAVEPIVCATPDISIHNGKIKISCATPNAKIHYSILSIAKESNGIYTQEIELETQYVIKAYATIEDGIDSKTASLVVDSNKLHGMIGDINNDGSISIEDITKLVDQILEK